MQVTTNNWCFLSIIRLVSNLECLFHLILNQFIISRCFHTLIMVVHLYIAIIVIYTIIQAPRPTSISFILDTPSTKYKVSVHTGDKFRSGTDSNVYVTLFGQFPGLDSGRQVLKHPGKNSFERKQVEDFYIECIDLGMWFSLYSFLFYGVGDSASWFYSCLYAISHRSTRNNRLIQRCIFLITNYDFFNWSNIYILIMKT